MGSYKLTSRALRDTGEIISYAHRKRGAAAANGVEKLLFAGFQELADVRGLGHRRLELTDRDVLFHAVIPYMIMFRRRRDVAEILRVAHGARDLRRLL